MLATWGCTTFPKPTLDLELAGATSLDSRVTFTRGSQATLFDSTGTLVFAPNNVIRNNTMVGAVAGTPGTLPTNWSVPTTAGLTTNVIGTGASNGITYIDLQVTGTTSATSYILVPEAATQIAALNGQTWTMSAWWSIVSGDLTNVTAAFFDIRELDSGGVQLASGGTSVSLPTSTFTRISATRTNTNASTAFVQPRFRFTVNNTSAVNFTLRIGMPQLERGDVATAVNATSGTAYYGPRFDYDPSTLAARGLLIEEARTNSIRNNTMQGAVAGTPGTTPTNWTQNVIASGLTRTIVGTGITNGITWIDIQFQGTTSNANGYALIFETTTGVAATSGQTWTASAYFAISGGSTANITNINLRITERDGAGAALVSADSPISVISSLSRFTQTRTLTNASTAFVASGFSLTIPSGVAIDITLRIGLPQLELGAFVTSVIPTTTTALTRSVEVASMTGTNFSSWFNAVEGTMFSEATFTNIVSFNTVATLGDGTTSNVMRTIQWNDGTDRIFAISNLGASQAAFTSTSQIGTAKFAGAYQVNNINASKNGSIGTTDTLATIPTVTGLWIGATGTNLFLLNGWVRRISYYPSRLANATLQALTA